MDASFITIEVTILIGFLVTFLTSYSTEKGKNAAIRSDIGKITKIVEEAKQEFSNNSEVLKSKLNIVSQSAISIKSLEREAILKFHQVASKCMNELAGYHFVFYNYDNFEKLKDSDFEFLKSHLEFRQARDYLFIFWHDQQIRDIIFSIDSALFSFQMKTSLHTTLFIDHCYEVRRACNGKSHDEIANIANSFYSKRQKLTNDHVAERDNMQRVIYAEFIALTKIINARIIQLVN